MAKNNDGKELEVKLQDALKRHQAEHKTNFVRFYDATSSGGRGHAQAGDYLWMIPGQGVLIECKSSEVGTDLLTLIRSSKTSRAQIARHHIWHIAQHPSVYFYLDLVTREVQAYCGKSVVLAANSGKKDQLTLISVGGLNTLDRILNEVADHIDNK